MQKSEKFTINILAERKIKYVELDIDMPFRAKELLLSYARDNVLFDEDALINWAFVDVLEKSIHNHKKLINMKARRIIIDSWNNYINFISFYKPFYYF